MALASYIFEVDFYEFSMGLFARSHQILTQEPLSASTRAFAIYGVGQLNSWMVNLELFKVIFL